MYRSPSWLNPAVAILAVCDTALSYAVTPPKPPATLQVSTSATVKRACTAAKLFYRAVWLPPFVTTLVVVSFGLARWSTATAPMLVFG